MAHEGFTVTNSDAVSLMLGAVGGSPLVSLHWGTGEHYLQTSGITKPVSMVSGGAATYRLTFPAVRPSVSPDGRWEIVASTLAQAPASWSLYPEPIVQMYLREWRMNPLGMNARMLQQSFPIDMDTVQALPLFDAPAVPFGTGALVRWSPDGNSVLLGSTFLPLDVVSHGGLRGYGWATLHMASGRIQS